MEAINNIVNMLNGPIWGVGMLVLIVGSGLYFYNPSRLFPVCSFQRYVEPNH